MTLGLGIGLRPGGKRATRGGKRPVLSWDFSRMGTLPAELAVERTGLAGMWQDDGSLRFAPHNLLLRSSELNVSPWDANSSGVLVTAGPETGEYLVEDNPGSGNSAWFLQTFSGAASTAFTLSCWLRVDSGTKSVLLWLFDDVSGGARSSAITVTTEWTRVSLTATPPAGATLFRAGLDNVPLGGVRVKRVQVNRGTVALDYVATTTAARYLMRFERHPSTVRRGLVGEDATTNLFANPLLSGGGSAPTGWQMFTNTGTSVPATSSVGPEATAYEQTANAERPYFRQAVAASANTTYTLSYTIEAVTGTLTVNGVIGLDSLPAGGSITGYTFNGVSVAAGDSIATPGVLAMTVAIAATSGTIGWRFGLGSNGAVTGTMRMSRPQLEAKHYASSFFAGTRSTDPRVVYSLPAALQTRLASGGTIFCEFAFLGGGSTASASFRHAMVLYNAAAAANNRMAIYNHTGNVGVIMLTGGAFEYSDNNLAPVAAGTRVRAAFTFSAGRCRAAVNGSLLALDSSATLFTPDTLALLGDYSGNATLGGVVYKPEVFADVLTDAELQALTAA